MKIEWMLCAELSEKFPCLEKVGENSTVSELVIGSHLLFVPRYPFANSI